MVEIFANRMEITNPGLPLVKTDRFLDSPPKSRNEALASFMRRIGVCEERGSGLDQGQLLPTRGGIRFLTATFGIWQSAVWRGAIRLTSVENRI